MNNTIVQYFLYGNLYLGVLAVSLVWASEKLFSLPSDGVLKWFVFFSTLLVYNLDRISNLVPDTRNTPERAGFFRKNRTLILWISAFSVLPLAWIVLHLSWSSLLWFVPLGLVTLLYLYVFGWRQVGPGAAPLFKPVILSLVWTSVVVAAPFAVQGRSLEGGALWLCGIRFLQYFANGILFDFRDVRGDRKEGKANFVVSAGASAAIWTGFAVLSAALAITLYALSVGLLPGAAWAEVVVILFYLIVSVRVYSTGRAPLQKEIHYALFLDGALFLPALALALILLF